MQNASWYHGLNPGIEKRAFVEKLVISEHSLQFSYKYTININLLF